MVDQMIMNARKPSGDEYGQKMLERMNTRHDVMALWALDHVNFEGARDILDVGCGGGKNLVNMLKRAPEAKLHGIDYSDASVAKSKEVNKDAMNAGKVEVLTGTAQALPFEQGSMDVVTAFETIYYWPEIDTCFKSIFDCLTAGGRFMVCNEDNRAEGNEEIQKALDMTFYSTEDLEKLMKAAGFTRVEKDTHENGNWICVVGHKE